MKKKLINFIREKLPFLFVFCVKRGWIYPEPLIYGNSMMVGMDMSHAYLDLRKEVVGVLHAQIISIAFEVYRKWNYFPDAYSLEFLSEDDPINFRTVYKWRVMIRYNPFPNIRDIDSLLEKLKEFYLLKK